ncbi:hypothetical protein GCM10027047_04690 [Rhodococcus aerolatus]
MTGPGTGLAGGRHGELADLLGTDGLRARFRPVVDLATDVVVGHEALVLGPAGTRLADPLALASVARSMSLGVELDEARWAAARAVGGASGPLLLRVDPASLPAMPALHTDAEALHGAVLAVDADAVAAGPAEVLRAVSLARDLGWAVAVCGVGRSAASLSLLSLVEADVIVLDPSMLRREAGPHTGVITHAVIAHVERTGAAVVAEGVEAEADRWAAMALGATLGTGPLLGKVKARPGTAATATGALEARPHLARHPAMTPFELVSAGQTPRRTTKRVLIEMSKHLEASALDATGTAVVLGTFQDAHQMTPRTRERWSRLAATVAHAGALAVGLDTEPAPGVRGVSLAADDPLHLEWDVAVLTPHVAVVLCALDLGMLEGKPPFQGPDSARVFDYVISHDRDLVVRTVGVLLERMAGPPPRR